MDGSGGGGAGLGVIVGALVVVVAIIGVIAFSGGNFLGGSSKSIERERPRPEHLGAQRALEAGLTTRPTLG